MIIQGLCFFYAQMACLPVCDKNELTAFGCFHITFGSRMSLVTNRPPYFQFTCIFFSPVQEQEFLKTQQLPPIIGSSHTSLASFLCYHIYTEKSTIHKGKFSQIVNTFCDFLKSQIKNRILEERNGLSQAHFGHDPSSLLKCVYYTIYQF